MYTKSTQVNRPVFEITSICFTTWGARSVTDVACRELDARYVSRYLSSRSIAPDLDHQSFYRYGRAPNPSPQPLMVTAV